MREPGWLVEIHRDPHCGVTESWDTSTLSDGDYVIAVTARDAAGNTSTQSMTVTTNNGNP